ncbi:recombinase family protein [Falsiroseomonas oryzae]|uniref:recombinase family protein n=1 Tax=Falsiroseomonas oryzae TaxID=2766473 RepID=UPI0022EA80C1|nr:recombinase family protein [Roseomonas sp. MO-31]
MRKTSKLPLASDVVIGKGPDGTVRVALYVRVSTGRQAAGELSVPDQIARMTEYCEAKGWKVVAIYTEAATATDYNRPEFTKLIDTATALPRPYEVVAVHSYSRIARDSVANELAHRQLAKVGARMISITQNVGQGTTGELTRKIIAVFDEFQSHENSKHTHRTMLENARQGYFNGSIAPFGFHANAVGKKGARVKKILDIDEDEASIVRRAYAMCLGREGEPLGLKRIVERLHGEGLKFRGKRFTTSNVYRILTSEVYAGTLWYNRICARTGVLRPREEWVAVSVPPTVSKEDFDRVQEVLASRAPKKTPPRITSSPVLLTGLATCATCGGGMTLRTGKSGRYRYYTCASAAHSGKAVCPGRSLPMDGLDQAVVDVLADAVLKPERLSRILEAYLARSAEGDVARRERLARARKDATGAVGTKARLMKLVAAGAVEPDDPQLAEELRNTEARRRRAEEEIALLETEGLQAKPQNITPAKIERLGMAIREALRTGTPEFRRAYVRLFVRQVVVGDTEIKVSGPTAALAGAVARHRPQSTADSGSQFHAEWRRKGNPRQPFSEATPTVIRVA